MSFPPSPQNHVVKVHSLYAHYEMPGIKNWEIVEYKETHYERVHSNIDACILFCICEYLYMCVFVCFYVCVCVCCGGRQGFNDQEIVALSGAHALGRCHTDRYVCLWLWLWLWLWI